MGDEPSQSRRRERWIALCLSTIAALLLVEIALRMAFSSLPSIAGLQGTEYRLEQLVDLAGETDPSLCHEVRTFLSHRSRWSGTGGTSGVPFEGLQTFEIKADGAVLVRGVKSGPARNLWIAGDSLAYGLGVPPDQTFSTRLADRMAEQTGTAVNLRNLAIPGAGYCTSVQRVVGALKANDPDMVLLVLSADDLEERMMLNVQGQLVALPDLAQSTVVRWAVHRSYTANLLWFQAVGMGEVASGSQARFVSRASQETFQSAMAGLNKRVVDHGGTLLVAIVEPPGMPLCVDPVAKERCDGLTDDMKTMAALLDAAGIPTAHVHGMWSGKLDEIVDREHNLVRSGGLGMHPSGAGHSQVTDALWPDLAQAL